MQGNDHHSMDVERRLFYIEIKKKIRLVVIVAALLAILFYSINVIYPPVNISAIYEHAEPQNALNPPEITIYSGTAELELDQEYLKCIGNESTEITEKEKLAVINKWNTELYPLFNVFMLSTLMDSTNYTYYKDITSNSANFDQKAAYISRWAEDNLLHTQHLQQFSGQPGRDPWGSIYVVQPVYKKVLPSEMIAKSIYTGKITGKCCSLAAFITDLFALNGAEPDNIVILRLDGHNIGLVKNGDSLYLCNNKTVSLVGEDERRYLKSKRFIRFSSYSVTIDKKFTLGDDFFASKKTLLDTLLDKTDTRERLPDDHAAFMQTAGSRSGLFDQVFGGAKTRDNSRTYSLARYAYQSLYVKNPELYLKASVRAPVTKALAGKIKTRDGIFQWIRSNISNSPVFCDYRDRIMLADQVIIFKKGTKKDQAVLAYSLLKLNGCDPEIMLTRSSAYVKVDNEIYEAGTWSKTDMINEPVIISLK